MHRHTIDLSELFSCLLTQVALAYIHIYIQYVYMDLCLVITLNLFIFVCTFLTPRFFSFFNGTKETPIRRMWMVLSSSCTSMEAQCPCACLQPLKQKTSTALLLTSTTF